MNESAVGINQRHREAQKGDRDRDCYIESYESEFMRNRPYMDKGQRKFWPK